ncbi:A24 family peptidase [Antrihabitans stalagmiti]|uniref:A24 family peptidase n=1 Tax=Antrihabitans stalagmiti TaxID=2799499 RepID=UPI0027DD9D35|nr:A24 family peptidase [Antrihabitans stalagmiti]
MPEWIPFVVFTAWCAALSVIDATTLRLPNASTLLGAVAVLGYGVATGRGSVAVIGGLLLALLYLTVHLLAPSAMGAGDVKLAIGVGAAAALGGGEAWVLAALLAPLGTAVAGLVLIVRRRRSGRTVVPHGPFMCAATVFALVAG